MALTRYAHHGKFEGQRKLAPLAYDATMNGSGEPYDFGVDGYVDHYTVCHGPLEVTAADIAEYNLSAEDAAYAANLLAFIVHVDDRGFVSVMWFEPGEEEALAETINALDADMDDFETGE
jgi:hypothetical protein